MSELKLPNDDPKLLNSEIRRLNKLIRERRAYYAEQEASIQEMINLGNNMLHELAFEETEMRDEIAKIKNELIDVDALLVDKRFELAILQQSLENTIGL